MANSTITFDAISQSQSAKEVTANAFFDAVSQASLYGRRQSTTTGLVFGIYGGNVVKSDGTMVQIANTALTLTASTTCYIVALKVDGVVSFATTTTNWNDRANYWRLYSVVTGTSTITSYIDSRELATMNGMRTGLVAPITITATTHTLGSNENEVIFNSTATCTVTFPSAASWTARRIRFKTIAAFTVISASSNIVPLISNTAGTSILSAAAGKWVEIVSDGTNWVIMSGN